MLVISLKLIGKVEYRELLSISPKELLLSKINPSLDIELVRMVDGKLRRASRFVEKLFDLSAGILGDEVLINIGPGDSIFMLDASWIQYEQFLPHFEKVRKNGGKVITMVYDLIPIRFPETCHKEVLNVFEKWLNAAIFQSDVIIGISKSVVDDVALYLREKGFETQNHNLNLAFIHLGADVPKSTRELNIRMELQKLSNDLGVPLFLMVGTIEPRKGYDIVLDAFDILWEEELMYQLCIVGKIGWNVEQIEGRIEITRNTGKIYFLSKVPLMQN